MNHKESGAVFQDLEIEYNDALSDPVSFANRCISKAKELEDICKQDTSVRTLQSNIARQAVDVDVPPELLGKLNEVYNAADDITVAELTKLIDAAQGLVTDLKNVLHERVVKEATLENSTVQDKRYAHMQYIRLRKAYDGYRDLIKMLKKDLKLPILKALPGNYGGALSENLVHYMFTIDGTEGEYFNHRAVAKLIGLDERFHTLGDFLDWCDSEDNNVVQVREVKK